MTSLYCQALQKADVRNFWHFLLCARITLIVRGWLAALVCTVFDAEKFDHRIIIE